MSQINNPTAGGGGGGNVTGTGEANRVALWDGVSSLTFDELYWDLAILGLGIGDALVADAGILQLSTQPTLIDNIRVLVSSRQDLTFDGSAPSGAAFIGVDIGNVVDPGAPSVWTTLDDGNQVFGNVFAFGPEWRNTPGIALHIASMSGYLFSPTVVADAAVCTVQTSVFTDSTKFTIENAGILTADCTSFKSLPSFGQNPTDAIMGEYRGLDSTPSVLATASLIHVIHVDAGLDIDATSVVSSRFGLILRAPVNGGAADLSAAVFVEDQPANTLSAALISEMNAGPGNQANLFCTGDAQSTHVGPFVFGAVAAPSSVSVGLELNSTTLAFVPSRLTTTEWTALTQINGMFGYNTTVDKFQGIEAGVRVNFTTVVA